MASQINKYIWSIAAILLITCVFAVLLANINPYISLTSLSSPQSTMIPDSNSMPRIQDPHIQAFLSGLNINRSLWSSLPPPPPDESLSGPLIIGNPMHSPKCRNALIHRDSIDIRQLLATKLPLIYNITIDDRLHPNFLNQSIDFLLNRTIPQFWGREQLVALQHDIEWWNGARVHVSVDPFWYFELQRGNGYVQRHANYQKRAIENRRSKPQKERQATWEQFHFHKHFKPNLPTPRYDTTKPIRTDSEFNESLKSHSTMPEVVYYHIPKCGSSSIKEMLYEIGGTRIDWRQSLFDGYVSPRILNRNIKCGFTFVRHPIHRFISGYYTLNWMLHSDSKTLFKNDAAKWDNVTSKLKHWHIVDECFYNFSCLEREHVFIDQMVDEGWKWINNYKDVYSQRVMEHVCSITSHFMAAYDDWKIDYVGRVEQFEEHCGLLSRNISKCSTGYLEKYWEVKEDKEDEHLKGIVSLKEGSNKTDVEIQHRMDKAGQKQKHTLNRTLVDAYYALAIDQTLYEKLAEYYFQDFVCFDYDASFQSFVEFVRFNDPSFDPTRLRPSKIH